MANADVDEFVARLTVPWQQEQCREVLRITREASIPLEESIKWGHPFFEHNGAVVKWFVAKEWINIYFYKGHLLDDPEGCFDATDNSKMRTIKLYPDRPLRPEPFAALLEAAIKRNA